MQGQRAIVDGDILDKNDLCFSAYTILVKLRPMKSPSPVSLLVVSLLIFFLGFFLGFFSAHALKGVVEELANLFNPLVSLPPPMLVMAILANNILKTFVYMILGVLFAIPPVLFILANGFILGATSFFVVEEVGVLFLLVGLLPHGVLEVPAMLLSCALGIEIGLSIIRRIRGRDVDVGNVITSRIKAYFKIVAPLLILAAFVEVYVTQPLLQLLL